MSVSLCQHFVTRGRRDPPAGYTRSQLGLALSSQKVSSVGRTRCNQSSRGIDVLHGVDCQYCATSETGRRVGETKRAKPVIAHLVDCALDCDSSGEGQRVTRPVEREQVVVTDTSLDQNVPGVQRVETLDLANFQAGSLTACFGRRLRARASCYEKQGKDQTEAGSTRDHGHMLVLSARCV